MRDEKGSKKASAKTPAKNRKQTAKSTATKSSGAAKTSKPKGTAKPKAAAKPQVAPEGKVFRVDQNGSPIRTVDRIPAVEDCASTGQFTADTVNKMLDDGEVVYSEAFYYSTKREALAKWEKEQGTPEPTPEPVKIEAGSIVAHDDRVGEVRDHEGKLRVFFILDGKQKSAALTSKWVPATEDQTIEYRNSLALATQEQAIAETSAPLTDEEKARLLELETEFDELRETFEAAPFKMGRILNEIRTGRLNRESEYGASFGEYAFNRFGITREYAQNLAQLSGFMDIANETFDVTPGLQLSVNSANAMVRATNKLISKIGMGKVDSLDIIRPLVAESARLIVDIAPRNEKTGEPELSPRLVTTAMQVISDAVKTGRVHIDGKTYSAEDAAEKGLLNRSVQEQTILATAENIQAKRDIILKKGQDAIKRQETPVNHKPSGDGDKGYFTQTPPELAVTCEKHGATKIISIGSGRMQTKCECRWLIDAASGDLRCYEVKGKRVKTA